MPSRSAGISSADRLPTAFGIAAGVALLVAAPHAGAADALRADTRDPRAYGYQVGDLARREIVVHAPAGLALDTDSLPRVAQPGQPIELRHVAWQRAGDAGGSRYDLVLDYQVLLSPPEPRTFEMPALRLRFKGATAAQDIRIEAWPLTVSPLAPVEASPRTGLGEMQPDSPPPRIALGAAWQRFAALLAVAATMLLWLAGVYLGPPWWARRHRPFDRAWRAVRALPAQGIAADRDACRAVHAALNRAAGEVLFAAGVDRFVARRPAFAPERDALLRFFDLSRRVVFAEQPATAGERDAVQGLVRRCRDIERGAA